MLSTKTFSQYSRLIILHGCEVSYYSDDKHMAVINFLWSNHWRGS